MGTQITSKINIGFVPRNFCLTWKPRCNVNIEIRPSNKLFWWQIKLTATIKEVNCRILEVQKNGKKHGQYSKFSDNEKALIGKYTSQHGVSRAVKHFTDMTLKESTVRDWRNLYLKQLQAEIVLAKPGKEVEVKCLKMKKRGRPPLLGKDMDNHCKR